MKLCVCVCFGRMGESVCHPLWEPMGPWLLFVCQLSRSLMTDQTEGIDTTVLACIIICLLALSLHFVAKPQRLPKASDFDELVAKHSNHYRGRINNCNSTKWLWLRYNTFCVRAFHMESMDLVRSSYRAFDKFGQFCFVFLWVLLANLNRIFFSLFAQNLGSDYPLNLTRLPNILHHLFSVSSIIHS